MLVVDAVYFDDSCLVGQSRSFFCHKWFGVVLLGGRRLAEIVHSYASFSSGTETKNVSSCTICSPHFCSAVCVSLSSRSSMSFCRSSSSVCLTNRGQKERMSCSAAARVYPLTALTFGVAVRNPMVPLGSSSERRLAKIVSRFSVAYASSMACASSICVCRRVMSGAALFLMSMHCSSTCAVILSISACAAAYAAIASSAWSRVTPVMMVLECLLAIV